MAQLPRKVCHDDKIWSYTPCVSCRSQQTCIGVNFANTEDYNKNICSIQIENGKHVWHTLSSIPCWRVRGTWPIRASWSINWAEWLNHLLTNYWQISGRFETGTLCLMSSHSIYLFFQFLKLSFINSPQEPHTVRIITNKTRLKQQ